jgi:hypothetical protein
MTALSPSHLDRPFHGLWSLWDMFELEAGAFYDATTHLSSLVSWIGATTSTRGEDTKGKVFHEDTKLDDAGRVYISTKLAQLRGHLETLGARVTLLAVDDLLKFAEYEWTTWGHVKERLDEISNTLKRELSLLTLLVLESREQAYFAPRVPHFGTDVAAKFQATSAFEIDEAAKCLALGRSTACVFHLMRVMEVGIRAVARCLGIPDPMRAADRNWGNIFREIKNDLDAHGGQAPTKKWTVAGDKELFESAYASLDAVRVAWRNTTMHVENKYTTDEAEHIFVAVKGFMSRLASRCDENGDPKA